MWRVFGGAALVIAGTAAFIEAHSHAPGSTPGTQVIGEEGGHSFSRFVPGHSGLSQNA